MKFKTFLIMGWSLKFLLLFISHFLVKEDIKNEKSNYGNPTLKIFIGQ